MVFKSSVLLPGGGGSGVTSFDGRIGAVVPQAGDYAAFYVPYTGATTDVDLGTHDLTAEGIVASDGMGGFSTLSSTGLSIDNGAITIGDNSGSVAWIYAPDGSASFASGNATIDASGNLAAHSGKFVGSTAGEYDGVFIANTDLTGFSTIRLAETSMGNTADAYLVHWNTMWAGGAAYQTPGSISFETGSDLTGGFNFVTHGANPMGFWTNNTQAIGIDGSQNTTFYAQILDTIAVTSINTNNRILYANNGSGTTPMVDWSGTPSASAALSFDFGGVIYVDNGTGNIAAGSWGSPNGFVAINNALDMQTNTIFDINTLASNTGININVGSGAEIQISDASVLFIIDTFTGLISTPSTGGITDSSGTVGMFFSGGEITIDPNSHLTINGDVGIGTLGNTPMYSLDVWAGGTIGNSNGDDLKIISENGANIYIQNSHSTFIGDTANEADGAVFTVDGSSFSFFTNNGIIDFSSGFTFDPIAGIIGMSTNEVDVGGQLSLQGPIIDHTVSAGSSGQLLSSTGTQVQWIDNSALNASNISSGTLPAARLPNPSSTTLGGIESITATSGSFITAITTGGIPIQGQVAFSMVTGTATAAQLPAGGVPIIVGNARMAGLTAAQALTTYTVGASDTTFQISANVNITAVTIASFQVTCTYTDETNTSRTLVLNFSQISGTLVQTLTAALGAGAYEGVPLQIRAKAGTTIIIASAAGGTYTSISYNLEERIMQL